MFRRIRFSIADVSVAVMLFLFAFVSTLTLPDAILLLSLSSVFELFTAISFTS